MSHPEYHHKSSILSDGSRPKIRVAEVVGRFTTRKKIVFPFLLILFFAAPWIRFGGERLILIWVEKREFTILGTSFNSQDVYLIFFLVTGLAFSLFFITALVGRIWCGWTCPQTVFLEGVFRKIEHWIEGSKSEQLKLAKGPWNSVRFFKFVSKHFLFVLISIVTSATLVLYFVPGTYYTDMFYNNFGSHPIMLFWIFFISGLMYFDFAWFREQVCLILCPYGRLQSALTDDDSLVIGYDQLRGEPRGKSKNDGAGDCIDCGRCIAVCPTGIDIRAGLQLECVGCANCIDACDEMMTKLERLPGLIRYDSYNGLQGKKSKILRPRIYLYMVLMVIGILVASINIKQRTSFEANVIRLAGRPFFLESEKVRNQFEIHLVNKSGKNKKFIVTIDPVKDAQIIIPVSQIELMPHQGSHLPLMIVMPVSKFEHDYEINVRIQAVRDGELIQRKVQFLGPR